MNLNIINNFDALLFDLDGTIAHSMPIHNQAWIDGLVELLGDRAKIITHDMLNGFAGISTLKTIEIFNERYGFNLDPQSFSHTKEQNFLNRLHEVTIIKNVYDVIKLYSSKPMAIVSGGPRNNVQKMLKHLQVENYFPCLVCAEDTILGKPHPDPFLKASELLNVQPSKCLVFEDGEAGIIGAQKAKMSVVKVHFDQTLEYLEPMDLK